MTYRVVQVVVGEGSRARDAQTDLQRRGVSWERIAGEGERATIKSSSRMCGLTATKRGARAGWDATNLKAL